MTDMKIVDGHIIFTPGDHAFTFVVTTHMREPDLFAEGLGDRYFFGD